MANNQVNVSATGVLKIVVNLISQNQANNTSQVQVIGQMINTGSVASFHLDVDIGRNINGTVFFNGTHFAFNIAGGQTFNFIDETFTITHDADGTKSVDFSVTYGPTGTATFGDNKTVSISNVALTRIPKRPSAPHTPNFSNVTGTSLTVSWGKSDDNGGSAIDSYLLRRSTTSTFASHTDNSANNTARTVTGLTPGGTYFFRVFAHNGSADADGFSPASPDNHAVMPSAPGGGSTGGGTTGNPSGMTTPTLSNVTSDSLTVTWTPPSSDGGNPIDFYELIQWNNVGGTGTPTETEVFGTTQDVTDLTPGSGYRFSVKAHNSVGLRAGSPAVTVTLTSSPSDPGTPTFSNVLPTSLTLSWSKPSNTGGTTITGYRVRRYDGTDTTSDSFTDLDLTSTGTSTSITDLNPGATYTFVIFAQNGSTDNDGFSDPSAPNTILMPAAARIRVNGVWKIVIPFIRNDGVWIQLFRLCAPAEYGSLRIKESRRGEVAFYSAERFPGHSPPGVRCMDPLEAGVCSKSERISSSNRLRANGAVRKVRDYHDIVRSWIVLTVISASGAAGITTAIVFFFGGGSR